MKKVVLTALLLLGAAFTVYGQQVSGGHLNAAARTAESLAEASGVVIDSDITFEEAVSGIAIPEWIIAQLTIIDVFYLGFDGRKHRGQLVVNKRYADEVKEVFDEAYRAGFPIEKIRPASLYGWSDDSSMADNNTSCFQYRTKTGMNELSQHAYGTAVDVNPWLNPLVRQNRTYPEGAVYDPARPGTITDTSSIRQAFLKRGWSWGGKWRSSKDYQHFYK